MTKSTSLYDAFGRIATRCWRGKRSLVDSVLADVVRLVVVVVVDVESLYECSSDLIRDEDGYSDRMSSVGMSW